MIQFCGDNPSNGKVLKSGETVPATLSRFVSCNKINFMTRTLTLYGHSNALWQKQGVDFNEHHG